MSENNGHGLAQLCEQTNADLASLQQSYSQWLQLPFTQLIQNYALGLTARLGQSVINTLSASEQAEYFAQEKMANGTYFRDAFYAEVSRIKSAFLTRQGAARNIADSARGSSLRDDVSLESIG